MAADFSKLTSQDLKSCCITFYENDLIARIFGDNFHPGGEQLTLQLGEKLKLNENSRVLDVACGPGNSALALTKQFGCHVTGTDLSAKNLDKAQAKAESENLTDNLDFKLSDAEKLEFEADQFDAVICECALCTFPNKETAVNEMFRVLKKGGMVGITDVTIEEELPDDLKNVFTYAACIAGALPVKRYDQLLQTAGFGQVEADDHSNTVLPLLNKVEKLVRSWKTLNQICNCDVEKTLGIGPEKAKVLVKMGYEWLDKGAFGYWAFVGTKP
jgi:ubiquinone/menaquinone biosynthesis C-methylase UbiE